MATIVKIEPVKQILAKHVECGATIQYDIREVREVYYADYGGGGDTYYEATCPHCGKQHQWVKR